MKANRKSLRRGFSLIEVLVALAFLAIIIATFLPLLGWLVSRSRASAYDAQATLVLQESMEVAYNVMAGSWDGEWTNYPAGVYHPAVDVSASPEQWVLIPGAETGVETRYNRQIEIFPVCREQGQGNRVNGSCPAASATRDNSSKLFVGTVSWLENGRLKSISAELLVINMGS